LQAEARKLAKQYGAKGLYESFGPQGDPYVKCFAFDSPPDPKLFVKMKGAEDAWRPRARTELEKLFEKFHSQAAAKTMKLTGVKPKLEFVGTGFAMHTIGIRIVGKVAYLTTSTNASRGCKRISDIEFEKATNKKKAPSRH